MKFIGGDSPTNGAKKTIQANAPIVINTLIEGVSDYLFHRWNCEDVEEKSKSAKGSKSRKTDNIENFVYRDDDGFLSIPAEQLRMSIVSAAKFKQDPRSPRKSAMDLYKASIIILNKYGSLGTKKWDYEDKRRVVIQRNGVNRIRPAMKAGWKCEFQIQVILPEFISYHDLHSTLDAAGKLQGIGDFRPTFGRFQINKFELL